MAPDSAVATSARPPVDAPTQRTRPAQCWAFLSLHGLVLTLIAQRRDITMRDIARSLDISERWVQQIVLQLVEAGYLSRRRNGRHNEYDVHTDLPMRHALVRHCAVGRMIELLDGGPAAEPGVAGVAEPGADERDVRRR